MLIIYHSRSIMRNMARELEVARVYPSHPARSRAGVRNTTRAVNWGTRSSAVERLIAERSLRIPRFVSPHRVPNLYTVAVPAEVLNRNVDISISKISTFAALTAANVPIPRYAVRFEDLPGNGRYLGRRDNLARGDGIVIYEADQTPNQEHDFFVRVVSKLHEFRFHVWRGEVIYSQRKVMPRAAEGQPVPLIRSHGNGASFSSQVAGVLPNDLLVVGQEIAIRAVAALGLDFAAVDVALCRDGSWVVFETNTAPGIDQLDIEGRVSSWDAYKAVLTTYLIGE